MAIAKIAQVWYNNLQRKADETFQSLMCMQGEDTETTQE
jgi:hypothetical protein